jgi:anti-sigma regulatory factor (Ser/Thr protein kinase)
MIRSEDRPAAEPRTRSARWVLERRADSVSDAREATRRFLEDEQRIADRDDAVLVVSELVSNAVRHAQRGAERVELKMELLPGALHIEVTDDDPNPPVPLPPRANDETGRGLQIVQQLSDRWGWEVSRGVGKRIWCDLADN